MGGRTRASRFAPKSASVDADDDDQDEDYLASEIDDSDDDDSDTGTSDSDTDDDQEDPEDDDVLRARLAKSMAGQGVFVPPEADDDGALPDEPGLSDKDFDAFFPEENYVEDLLADPDADSDDESRGSELRRLRAIAGPSNADKAATTTPPVPLSPQASRADIPIAQRTRAHVSLEDVQLEELEAILSTAPIDEPLLNFGVDDSAEYERFLQTLQTMPLDQGFHTDTEAEGEDSEDEDFLNELERMLEEEAAAMGIGAEALQDLDIPWLEDGADNVGRKRRRNDGSGLKRRGKRRKQKPPRRSERLMAKSSDRPHYASRLLERHNTAVAFQNPSDAFGLNQLATLAVAAAAMWDEPVRVKPQIGPRDGRRVPLPSDPQDVLEAQADDIVWKAPLPKAMRRAAERKGQVQPPPDGKEYADEPIAGAEVQPAQYAAIHLLLHQHAQALVQTLAMAVATGDADTAAGAKAMLVELCEFAGQQTRNREGMGYPPYVDECLGVHVMDQPQLKGDPWRPLTARRGSMYTVANALVLSQVGDMLALMPPSLPADQVLPPMVPASGDGEDEAGASGPPGKKKKRKKPNHHPIWAKLPVSVARAIAPVRAFFDPDAEPGVPDGFNPTSQLLFTPAEDVLLAWGIRKHGYDWEKIKADLLPCKTAKMLFHRKKNRVAGNAPPNPVKNAVNIITKKLTPAEITFLERALAYYGRGPMRWDVICRDYLRHRHPMVLSMLWSEHLKRGTQPEDPAVQPALMAGQKNARQAARPAAAATAPGPAPAAAPQAPGQAPPESQNVGDFGAAVAAVAEAMYGPRAVPAPEPNANASVAHGAATAGGAVHDAYPPATTAAATFVGAGAGQQPSQAQQAQQDLHAAWQQAMGPGCWPMMMPGMGLPMMGAAMGMPGMIPGMGMPMVPGHSMQSMHGMHGMMYPGFYMPNMAPGPAGMAAQYPWPYPGSPGPMQQPAQQQQQGVLAGPSAAVARGGAGEDGSGWSADDNRTVLYAAVENGGAFSDEDMQKLAEKLGKSKEEVMNRWNSVLASRFKEKVRQMVDMD